MRKKVTRGEFRKAVAEEILARLGPSGFKEYAPGAYGRGREDLFRASDLRPDASIMKFCVSVGFVLPSLWEKTDFVLGAYSKPCNQPPIGPVAHKT